jgi:hypothetical protein
VAAHRQLPVSEFAAALVSDEMVNAPPLGDGRMGADSPGRSPAYWPRPPQGLSSVDCKILSINGPYYQVLDHEPPLTARASGFAILFVEAKRSEFDNTRRRREWATEYFSRPREVENASRSNG